MNVTAFTAKSNLRRQMILHSKKTYLSDEADYSELYHAMMQLDDKYRIPVELYYIEGYKIHEITDILNRSEGTIKSQLARGRQQLRKYLESEAAQ